MEQFLIPAASQLADAKRAVASGQRVPESILSHAGPAYRNMTDPRVYEGQARTHIQLRDAYEGQAMMLDYTIRGMVLAAPEAFVSVIYPLQETNQLSIEHNEISFNHVYVPEVPEESVPRVVTAEKRSRRGRMRRRMLAVRGEVTAVRDTPEGIEEFTMRARGIALCIIETMIMDTLFEITFEGSRSLERTSVYGPINNIIQQAQNENALTASLQRDEQQFAAWVEKFKHVMRRERRVTGSLALILAPETALYLQPLMRRVTQGERFSIKEELAAAGDMSVAQPVDSFSGMPIYEAPDLYIGNGQQASSAVQASAQFLTRNKLTAEFFPMVMGARRHMPLYDGMGCTDEANCYNSGDRDVYLYDAQTNRMERVRFIAALRAAGVGQDKIGPEDPDYGIPFNPDDYSGSRRAAKWNHYLDSRTGVMRPGSAKFAAQLDLNVYEKSDIKQAAQSVAAKMNDGLPIYNKTVSLLKMLEAVAPNTDYVTAQIAANYAVNHNSGGQFTGENPNAVDSDAARANGWMAQRQWAGVSAGGMNVPDYKARYGPNTAPPFMANWTGLKQLEALHFGGTRGWSSETCAAAAEVVPFWEKLSKEFAGFSVDNPMTSDKYRQPWEASAEAGCSLFSLYFGSRSPVFYADIDVAGGVGGATGQPPSQITTTKAPAYLSIGLAQLLGRQQNPMDIRAVANSTQLFTNYGSALVQAGQPLSQIATALTREPTVNAITQISDALLPGYAAIMSVLTYGVPADQVDDAEFERGAFATNLLAMTPKRAQAVVYHVLTKAGYSADQIRSLQGGYTNPSSFADDSQRAAIYAEVRALNNNAANLKKSKAPAEIKTAEQAIAANGFLNEMGGNVTRVVDSDADTTTLLAATGVDVQGVIQAVRNATRGDGAVLLGAQGASTGSVAGGGVFVASTGLAQNLAVAKWYRTPYTASPAQVRMLLATPGLTPVRIGDPRDGYKTPFEGVGGDAAARARGIPVPTWLTDRPELDPLERAGSRQEMSIDRFHVALIHGAAMEQQAQEQDPDIGAQFYGDMDIGANITSSTYATNATQGSELADIISELTCDNAQMRVREVMQERNGLLRGIMLGLLGQRVDNFEAIQALDAGNVHIFFLNALLIMPAAEFAFDSAIMMRPGAETGVNYFGHPSMMYGANATVQNFLGSYALYTTAFTKDPEAIIAIMDWRVRGYFGGASTDFFMPDDPVAELIREHEARDRPSLIATALPITENRFPSGISPSGIFSDTTGLGQEYARPHYSSARYENMYGHRLQELIQEDDYETPAFYRGNPSMPRVAFMGQVLSYVPGKGFSGEGLVRGESWRSQGCYPGALDVYNTRKPYFPKHGDIMEYVRGTQF